LLSVRDFTLWQNYCQARHVIARSGTYHDEAILTFRRRLLANQTDDRM